MKNKGYPLPKNDKESGSQFNFNYSLSFKFIFYCFIRQKIIIIHSEIHNKDKI